MPNNDQQKSRRKGLTKIALQSRRKIVSTISTHIVAKCKKRKTYRLFQLQKEVIISFLFFVQPAESLNFTLIQMKL